MSSEILSAVNVLTPNGDLVEVRALADGITHSGYFDDHEALARGVEALDADPAVAGIYVTLNSVNPALLARRANRIKMRLSRKDATTADADIIRRRWFPVDIDPVRPSGVSSTDAEHDAALAAAERIAAYLAEQGFGAPVRADSGNGAHLLYRVDLPNDEPSTALVKGCLTTLDALFSNEAVTVDTANHNAARIWKLYGTLSRKGDNTPERPHRRARLLAAPAEIGVVPLEQLQHLAGLLPREEPPRQKKAGGNGPGIDLAAWLLDHGIAVRSTRPYLGGTLYILEDCPFSSAHKDGAFAIQFANGAVFAGCHHASCGGGAQRWPELREMYEPREKQKKKREEAPAPPPAPVEDEHRRRATEILRDGDPLAFLLDTFHKEHVGDRTVAECLAMSIASQSVANTKGLHVAISGNSGKGKSHACVTMLNLIPADYKLTGTVSNKALYYMKDLRPRTVLMSDDTELSDGIQEILKSATSNFHEPITHTTVTKDLTSRVCTIPERCVWWIAKKEGTGDDQVMNRMLTCWIDESSEQDARVLAAKQEKEEQDPDMFTDEPAELTICREIWEVLHSQLIWVIIPYSRRIRFQRISNRRNPDMLYDLIKSHTALFFMQRRQKTGEDGTLCVYADEQDFAAATEVFTLLNGTAGGQESKMTKKESDLLAIIEKADRDEFTIQDLQKLTGGSYLSIYRMIKGYDSRGKNYTGLLEKCPALSFTDRTVTLTEENGYSVRRRTEAFEWDRELYRQWMNGGACWLDHNPKNDDDDSSHLSAVSAGFSSFSATAENENGTSSVPGSSKEDDCTNNSVLREGCFQQNRNYGGVTEPETNTDQYLHNSRSAENENRSSPGTAQSGKRNADSPPVSFSNRTKDAENVLKTEPCAENKGPPRTIRAKDYKKLEVPEPKTVCYACGNKGSRYVEKYTAERRARPKDQQQARRICCSCYNEAVKAEQTASVPLPGAVEISRCSRVTADIGKCSVCGVAKALWLDRETGVKLCEHCYGRGLRKEAEESGVV